MPLDNLAEVSMTSIGKTVLSIDLTNTSSEVVSFFKSNNSYDEIL